MGNLEHKDVYVFKHDKELNKAKGHIIETMYDTVHILRDELIKLNEENKQLKQKENEKDS